MNQVTFLGRLVRPVELKQIDPDNGVVNNSLAISRKHRNQQGEVLTDFIPFVAWNRAARILSDYCKKGDLVGLCGRMQSRQYQDREGTTKYVIECVVNEVHLLPNKPAQGDKDRQGQDLDPVQPEDIKNLVDMQVAD